MLCLIQKSLYCPLLCEDLIVETELDLRDYLKWVRLKRDMTLCELHNGNIDIICGWPNIRKKSCVLVSLILIYFMFLFRVRPNPRFEY
jgi:hypothetical protein